METKVLEEFFKADLPRKLEQLQIKTYIGATDIYSAELKIFSTGMLIPPLLGSMALPGIFPGVPYKRFLLNDGGIIDNFPTTLAQKAYSNHKIIGIALNKFVKQHPKNLVQTLMMSFEIMMRKDFLQRTKEIELAFYERIECGVLEWDKKKRKEAFEQGYRSGVRKCKHQKSKNTTS